MAREIVSSCESFSPRVRQIRDAWVKALHGLEELVHSRGLPEMLVPARTHDVRRIPRLTRTLSSRNMGMDPSRFARFGRCRR
jgi:hypothetical protein